MPAQNKAMKDSSDDIQPENSHCARAISVARSETLR